jgi:glutamate synthase domain-containing protein 2
MVSSLTINLEKISRTVNIGLPLLFIVFLLVGYFHSFYFHFLTVTFLLMTVINFFYLYAQKNHALLTNFGWVAQVRYLLESIGPEMRQYFFTNDTEERPFTRLERAEVYRKAKNIDSSQAYGSLMDFDGTEYKLRHSLFPMKNSEIAPYSLTFGEERNIANQVTITKPLMISAMSFGALGSHAVRALARGARKAGILMNTGEGGLPKYHLMEGCDLIFQMGTAKFGCRNEDGSLNEAKLQEIARLPQVKMIEIKFSQGAKPGKGGLLPSEKISKEISELRGVPMGKDVVSPPYHVECLDPESTVRFIRRVQDLSELPVGIKLAFGREDEFRVLVQTMKELDVFPDYISIDGAEGGTGASPKAFMDDLGVPILQALPLVDRILREEKVRDRLKLIAAGKLINSGRMFVALSLGAQACYTARGFMLALGCIQALTCNRNTCPVGITTHNPHLQKGLDIEVKSERVKNYVQNMEHEYYEILSALGKRSFRELDTKNLLFPTRVHAESEL